jgi:hypothetical protein
MLSRCATDVELVQTGYSDEVVYGLAGFQVSRDQVDFARTALRFRERTQRHKHSLRSDLDELSNSVQKVAIWGGTGKAAAFINQNGLDRERFPLVVDSDADKAQTCVPGTGQEIRFRDCLLEEPAEVILIATQWRAADICMEIERCGIVCQTILIEHQGRLVDFFAGQHPYHTSSRPEDSRSGTHPPSASIPRPKLLSHSALRSPRGRT